MSDIFNIVILIFQHLVVGVVNIISFVLILNIEIVYLLINEFSSSIVYCDNDSIEENKLPSKKKFNWTEWTETKNFGTFLFVSIVALSILYSHPEIIANLYGILKKLIYLHSLSSNEQYQLLIETFNYLQDRVERTIIHHNCPWVMSESGLTPSMWIFENAGMNFLSYGHRPSVVMTRLNILLNEIENGLEFCRWADFSGVAVPDTNFGTWVMNYHAELMLLKEAVNAAKVACTFFLT